MLMKMCLPLAMLLLGVSTFASAVSVFTTRLDDPKAVYFSAREFGVAGPTLYPSIKVGCPILRVLCEGWETTSLRPSALCDLNSLRHLDAAAGASHLALEI